MALIDARHPDYANTSALWEKWRLTYEGGDAFLDAYLVEYTKREDRLDFFNRKKLSPVPAFAAAAINDIRNSVYNRTGDIIRQGGSRAYQNAVYGQNGGVDLAGSTMSFFMGQTILTELLTMARVGIYVDMPPIEDQSKLAAATKIPYLYHYPIEDILSWNYKKNQLVAVLLRDYDYEYETDSLLPRDQQPSYRYLYLNNEGTVSVQFYDKAGDLGDAVTLNLTQIPFVMPSIRHSLLKNVCNAQIALMNLESSDVYGAQVGNFPIYTEQYDFASESPYLHSTVTNTSNPGEIKVGPMRGRRYAKGLERPEFINPSSEPLLASMKLQEKIQNEIRLLVNLSLTDLQPRVASTNFSESLEAGLSFLGQILENTDQKIARIWAEYEGSRPATILYPTNYSLPNPEEDRKRNESDLKLANSINSPTYKRELVKRIVKRSIGYESSAQTINTIYTELDSAEIVIADPDTIRSDTEAGLLSLETASLARTYPGGEVDKAKVDRAERIALTMAAQSPGGLNGARGLTDLAISSNDGKEEKAALLESGAEQRGNGRKVEKITERDT